MTYETKQAYSEVCAVLENMPNEYISKIPKKIIKLLFFSSYLKLKGLKTMNRILINPIHGIKIS